MRYPILLLSLLWASPLFSQIPAQTENSMDYLLKGLEFFEEGNYKSAIKQFSKVHHCDTNYSVALYEKAFSQWRNENYNDALGTIEKALLIAGETSEKNLLEMRANIYDDQKQYALAQEIYLEILKTHPYSYQTHFNLGLSYKNSGKFQEAVNEYKKTLELNPYHKNSWLGLAEIAKDAGKTALSALYYNMHLIMNPAASKETLVAFTEMMSQGLDVEVNTAIVFTDKDKEFSQLNEKLNDRTALNKTYKVKSIFSKVPMVRQNFLLISELGDVNVKDKLINDIKYLFSNVMASGNFDYTMGLEMLSSTSYDIQSKIKKKESKIKQVVTYLNGLMEKSFSRITTTTKEGKNITAYQFYGDGGLYGDNKSLAARSEEKETGESMVQLFSTSGYLMYEGAISGKSGRHGIWTGYDNKGVVLEKITYSKGELNGPFTLSNSDGFVRRKGSFENGNKEGKEYVYYENGLRKEEAEYKAGNLNGLTRTYDASGRIAAVFTMKEGKMNGEAISFYSDSTVHMKYNTLNDQIDGDYFEYYSDGKLKTEIHAYKAGKINGEQIDYHRNGKVARKINYLDGKATGTEINYYSDGTKYNEYNYNSSGKLHGITTTYNREGNKYIEIEYENNEVVSYKYFNKEGELKHTDEVRRKKLPVQSYYEDGTVLSKGLDVKGEKQGEWHYYNEYGRISAIENYEKGMIISNRSFDADSVLVSSNSYKDGQAEGMSKSFYQNGKLYAVGQYTGGNQTGLWLYYNPDGTLRNEKFFDEEGKTIAYEFNYTNNGKLCESHYYDKTGVEKLMVHFDTAGNALDTIKLKGGNGVYEMRFPNGRLAGPQQYVNWNVHGKIRQVYPNGIAQMEGEYFTGFRHGHWKWYHPNGKISSERHYHMGNSVGAVKYWYINGKLAHEFELDADGDQDGDEKYYNYSGTMVEIAHYKYGLLHGERTQFNDDGQVELIRYYRFGKLLGYSYHNAQGKPAPMVPLENGSGHVKSYFPNGKIARDFNIDRGLFDGLYLVYWPNGQLADSFKIVAGNTEGTRVSYYKNGKIKNITPYFLDEFHGISKSYGENGKLLEENEYAHGELEGIRKIYDQNGKLLYDMYYFNETCIYLK